MNQEPSNERNFNIEIKLKTQVFAVYRTSNHEVQNQP